ncbi:hypothetical protein [Mycoplasmopsis caviae]|uniref:Uncharacterized protein n=1 Tax=Mycoplasmopsis caviae TaxID=55603 RepID=A0A3P8L858_9BACT|nr:hypothetical protein [Mycoplasmopsis caviae]VDR42575.1 Uncharacterised protein [Mycoplasmopsis caviae]
MRWKKNKWTSQFDEKKVLETTLHNEKIKIRFYTQKDIEELLNEFGLKIVQKIIRNENNEPKWVKDYSKQVVIYVVKHKE